MEQYNLESEIDNLLEEKVFKTLESNRIAIRKGLNFGDFDFLVRGKWYRIEDWSRHKDNKKEISEMFKNNKTVYFFEDMFDFCKWFIENCGRQFDKNKYQVIKRDKEKQL